MRNRLKNTFEKNLPGVIMNTNLQALVILSFLKENTSKHKPQMERERANKCVREVRRDEDAFHSFYLEY